MKFLAYASRMFAALALMIALVSAPAAALAQNTGSAAGQWYASGPNATVVLAEMHSDQSETLYDLRLRMVGAAAGQVRGEMRQRVQSGEDQPDLLQLVYRVEGRYSVLADGRILARCAIALDLSQFGAVGLIRVGMIEGLLFPVPDVLGHCPVLPFGLGPIGDIHAQLKGSLDGQSAISPIDPSPKVIATPGEFIARWILN